MPEQPRQSVFAVISFVAASVFSVLLLYQVTQREVAPGESTVVLCFLCLALTSAFAFLALLSVRRSQGRIRGGAFLWGAITINFAAWLTATVALALGLVLVIRVGG